MGKSAKVDKNKCYKRKIGSSSSDEDFLSSGTPVKRRGPDGEKSTNLEVSDILNQANNILYEEDSFVINQPETSVEDKGTGNRLFVADILLKVNSSNSNPNMANDKGSVAVDPVLIY